jgi:hypothetical protein
MCGGFTHATSFHSVLGYVAVKHAFLGAGLRNMESLQAFRFCFSSGDTCSCAPAAADAVAVFGRSWAGTLGAPDDACVESSPNSNMATTLKRRIFMIPPYRRAIVAIVRSLDGFGRFLGWPGIRSV